MNFEKLVPEDKKQDEKNVFYPERASENVGDMLDEIKRLEKGDGVLELSEKEKADVLEFEKKLGIELENIFDIKIITKQLYVEYLATQSGRDDFEKTFGANLCGESVQEVERFILENQHILKGVKPSKRNAFIGRSRAFSEKKTFKALKKRMTGDGSLDISGVENPKRTGILLNSDKALEKIKLLREFRKMIKVEEEGIGNIEDSNIKKGKIKILEMYRRKSNQMLIEEFPSVALIKRKAEKIGENKLSTDEKDLLELFSGLSNLDKSYSRFDRWIHGASSEYNKDGNREQISSVLRKRAEEMKKLYIENEVNRNDLVREKGLDPKKVFENRVDSDEVVGWANEILERNGQKSSLSIEEYNPDRSGPAPDGKWQFIALSEIKSMSVDSRQKVIKSPNKNKSIFAVISVALGHEFAHFLQVLNKEKVPFKIFERIGSDRGSIFAEMGAMATQDDISLSAFSVHSYSMPSYVLAMIKKMDHGDYLDCVKEYYETSRLIAVEKKKRGSINRDEFQKELRKKMKISIKSAKRLFRGGIDFDSDSKYLSKSKDTVYLEQFFLAQKMRAARLEKYAFLGGANLRTIKDLLEIGVLKQDDIQELKFSAMDIWNRIKDKYELKSGEEQSELRE